jgi:hypothetical protein
MKHITLALALYPAVARAEVMDKEPSLLAVWVVTLLVTSVCFVLARFRPWLLVLAIPVTALLSVSNLSEVTDSLVGPAIQREAGFAYVASSWASPILALVGLFAGLWLRKR